MTAYRYIASSPGEVNDHLGTMFLYLPEYKLPNSDLNIDGEFIELRESLETIMPKIGDSICDVLIKMSHESEVLYAEGNNKGGAFKLRDMQKILKKR